MEFEALQRRKNQLVSKTRAIYITQFIRINVFFELMHEKGNEHIVCTFILVIYVSVAILFGGEEPPGGGGGGVGHVSFTGHRSLAYS